MRRRLAEAESAGPEDQKEVRESSFVPSFQANNLHVTRVRGVRVSLVCYKLNIPFSSRIFFHFI
jgi:hypothetical protein